MVEKSNEQIDDEVKKSLEAIYGKEPYDFEKVCRGAMLSPETINQLRKKLGLPPRT